MAAQLTVSTYYGLLRLLGTCAAGSHSVAEVMALAHRTIGRCHSISHTGGSQTVCGSARPSRFPMM